MYSGKTICSLLLKLIKNGLLLRMDMVHQHVVLGVVREHDDGWLDALIDKALSVGRRKNNDAGIAFSREAIDAIVVILVKHPEFVLFNQLIFFCALFATEHR